MSFPSQAKCNVLSTDSQCHDFNLSFAIHNLGIGNMCLQEAEIVRVKDDDY